MLLQRLAEYAANQDDQLPKMYQEMPIRWLIKLTLEGKFQGFSMTVGDGKKTDRGKRFVAPSVSRTVGIKANLLADNGEYVLGANREPGTGDNEKVQRRHQAFRDLIVRCAEATDTPGLRAVQMFLTTFNPEDCPLPEGFDAKDNLTFSVADEFPFDLPVVRRFWGECASEVTEAKKAAAKGAIACLICGEVKPIADRHPVKIKGIPDGQTSGMTLISANANAFESYGLTESTIAPTCLTCAEAYANGLNQLLRDAHTHLRLGPLVYAFWTKGDPGFSIATLLKEPRPEDVGMLLTSIRSAKPAAPVDDAAFYATALSASGARVVVRDWLETTVSQASRHIGRYFALQRLVGPDGAAGKPVGLFALAGSLFRDAAKDMQVGPTQALIHCALHGGPLPTGLLQRVVQRNRAEQGITYPRAVLIKMVLLSQQSDNPKEDFMVALDTTSSEPAYLCGRLFAELEAAQRAAIPGLSATIVDRYYGTASTAPGAVFGHLLKGAQNHLSKLRKEREGAYNGIQARLEDIQMGLTAFPAVLNLRQQATFALGYYHQRSANRTAATEAKAKKAASGSPSAS